MDEVAESAIDHRVKSDQRLIMEAVKEAPVLCIGNPRYYTAFIRFHHWKKRTGTAG